jgi:acyl-CoA dehydrogenase family member 9
VTAPSSAGFVRGLFAGEIDNARVSPFPRLADGDRRRVHALTEHLRELGRHSIDAERIDADGAVAEPVHAELARFGCHGLWIPEQYGGFGFGATGTARVIGELAAIEPSLATALYVHVACGSHAIARFGSDAQRERLLPRLASGAGAAAFALVEGAGTDPAEIRTYAEWEPARRAFRIRGEKPWVTALDRSDLVIVVARTTPPAEGRKPKLTAFLVERAHGFRVGPRRPLSGLRGLGVCSLELDGVLVPEDAVLGEVGRGIQLTQALMDDARPIHAAIAVGQARATLDHTLARAASRRSLGRRIGEFPALQDKLTRMVADVYAIESLTYLTTGIIDRGAEDVVLESAICRVAASEALWRVVNEAAQIVASESMIAGAPVERQLRDARASFVLDATNETVRSWLALSGLRGQSLRRAPPPARPARGLERLRGLAERVVREPVDRPSLRSVHPLLERERAIFDGAVSAFADAIAALLASHGADVQEMQTSQLRIANTAIDLYALAACALRATRVIVERGEYGARRKLDVTRMFAGAAERRMRANIAGLGKNDDELRKIIAGREQADGSYPFDVL